MRSIDEHSKPASSRKIAGLVLAVCMIVLLVFIARRYFGL
jgi:hypothetical protein